MATFSASKLDKRQDIQGLRAVAIIAVLFYHAWPKRFPSGFLGVDVFFVISGYLMSAILLRQPITRKVCKDFYFRRIRRIVPTYLLVFSGIVLFCRILVFYGDVDGVLWELLPALTFTTNLMNIQKDENYFRQTYKYQFFLHTWSLGVEMQFYLFAPLLFSLLQRFRRPTSLLMCSILCIQSLLLQQSVSKEAAFGILFCRLWQFGAGALGYLLTNANAGRAVRDVVAVRDEDAFDKGDGSSSPLRFASYVFFAGLTFVMFLSYQAWNAFGQLFAVLFAFMLLTVGKYSQPFALTNAAFVKLGDISYTVYLVHWPVFQFWKYWNPYHLLPTESASWLLWLEIGAGIALIIFSIMIAYSVETYVDVLFRRLPTWRDLFNILVLLYTVAALAGFLLFTGRDETSATIESQRHELHRFARRLNDPSGTDIAPLLSTEMRIRLNVYAGFFDNSVQNCSDHFPYFANFTKGMDIIVWHCRVRGTGKKTAMLIGNSHALTMFEVVAEAFSGEYESFYFLAFPGCLPYYDIPQFKYCVKAPLAFQQAIEYIQPELLFVIHRFGSSEGAIELSIPKNNRLFANAYQNFLDSIPVSVEAVFFGGPNIEVPYAPAKEIAKRLWQKRPLFGIEARLKDHMEANAESFALLSSLTCRRCVFMDWPQAFCHPPRSRDAVCDLYDKRSEIGYLFDNDHLSLHGALKLLPYLQSLRSNYPIILRESHASLYFVKVAEEWNKLL